MYRDYASYIKEKFGTRVQKIALNPGFNCPNRDGKIGLGGCTYCNNQTFSPFYVKGLTPTNKQLEQGIAFFSKKYKCQKYIAYFQSFTNTYGEPERLRALYEETIRRPEIAALSIGTRPDCLSADILQMLGELSRIKPVWVELGLQTIHERTAEAVHRGYSLPAFEDAVKKLKAIGVEVIVHVILGLPGESREDMLETVRFLSGMDPRPDGIKLQQLQILRGTQLAEQYRRTPFPVMDLEEYCALIRDCLEILPDDIVIHRLTGDGPKKLLIAPQWSADKKRVLNTMRKWTAHKPPGGL